MLDAAATVEAFIARWRGADGRERANYQLFLTELAALLGLPPPEPAGADDSANAYVFERRVAFRHGDGSESYGYIDLYRRGSFVLEAKDVRESSAARYDEGMLRARSQAENYARALPAAEGRPPFVVVVDVGRSIELYSEFSRSGATYTPFPDPRSHRIRLDDLRDETVRARLHTLWLDPLGLDPARRSARVTREIAAHLAELARSLEAAGHAPQAAAGFLTRCLFTMFAEDVELIPAGAFRGLLESMRDAPAQFVPMVGELWQAMDAGLFSTAIRADLLRFNGKLFKHPEVLPLDRAQIAMLIRAAGADWREVEPAIFGTLLERALDPDERHALGAHYTPRAYVERLVLPTVIEPLREDWGIAQAAALTFAAEGDLDAALATIRDFHHALCTVRVLDPACGSGNFLYVTLEHMKRLEGEVLNTFDELDPAGNAVRLRQSGLALEGGRADPFGGETVDPHQLLGIEVNTRAAAIAELVLWIGYLQWHFRTRGKTMPSEPVLKDFRNIECRDAVLAWDRIEYATDERGVPLTRWDGRTMKASPVTGEPVPDDSARVPLERYVNPRRAAWPEADFVVGNPPYLGARRIRLALGSGYLDALRSAHADVPEHADYVMYWWKHAAELVGIRMLRRFGLITSNSIRQTFSRKVVDEILLRHPHVAIRFVIPDHPWVDAADGAAVRVAMTVLDASGRSGIVQQVVSERTGSEGDVDVALEGRIGMISPNLSVGVDPNQAAPLSANKGLACVGYQLTGSGFIVNVAQCDALSRADGHAAAVIRPLIGGRDIVQEGRNHFAIDLFGLSEEQVRVRYPSTYQWVLDRVKPERDQNNRVSLRESWWTFGEARSTFRPALKGVVQAIATSLTAKHRTFVLVPVDAICDSTTVMFALDDLLHFGVLSSTVHVTWSLTAGGRLGVGNDPRYNKTRCFDPFPFPVAEAAQQSCIRTLAEHLDTHRKRQQAAHPGLTLTGMYNVLEKLRSGEALSAKERAIHDQGLVSVLRQLHDELDLAVLDAYGWSDLAPLLRVAHGNEAATAADAALAGSDTRASTREDARRAFDEAVLERLVALNAERAAEERRGFVRWLRPEFQNPQGQVAPDQAELEGESSAPVATSVKKRPWPKELPEQVRAVADVLAAAGSPLDEAAIAASFSARGRWRERLPTILDTLVAIGRARRDDAGRHSAT